MTAGSAATGSAATKRRRVPLRRLGFWYGLAACILKPLTWAFMKKDWRGLEHVPREGGVILAVNHISHADPIAVADFVVYGADPREDVTVVDHVGETVSLP